MSKFSITLGEEEENKVREYMKSTNTKYKAEAIRLMLQEYKPSFKQDQKDIIAEVVREQMQLTLKPHTERLAKLIAKSGIMSATSTFLSVQVLQEIVPIEKRKQVKELYLGARKMAVTYLKSKATDDDIIEGVIKRKKV